MDITPFTIERQPEAMQDLYDRIDHTRLPASLNFDDSNRGSAPDVVSDALHYWRHTFDWDAMVTRLNELPQFITEIDGQRLHFIHVRSAHEDATPMLLLHGFPGSFLEFLHVIEPLADPEGGAPAFHLVIPSHPGYTFSTPISKPWGSHQTAELYAKLMAALGYDSYLAQGGDYGAFVAPDMGRVDPDHVKGIHVNAASWGFIPMHELTDEEIATLSEAEKPRVEKLKNYMGDINWYFDVQSKRPQTLGYAMADSPSGQLAWLLELYKDFASQEHPLIDDSRNKDIFFATATLYWLTNAFASATNPYFEGMHDWSNYPTNSGVPTGVAVFRQDASIRRYSEELNTITHWSDIDAGGHFAALETPDLLVEDIRAFAGSL